MPVLSSLTFGDVIARGGLERALIDLQTILGLAAFIASARGVIAGPVVNPEWIIAVIAILIVAAIAFRSPRRR